MYLSVCVSTSPVDPVKQVGVPLSVCEHITSRPGETGGLGLDGLTVGLMFLNTHYSWKRCPIPLHTPVFRKLGSLRKRLNPEGDLTWPLPERSRQPQEEDRHRPEGRLWWETPPAFSINLPAFHISAKPH